MNSLDQRKPKKARVKAGQSINMVYFVGMFWLEIGANGMENLDGNWETVQLSSRGEALDACADLL